ncbi:PIR Superfamily Protein [Plasmodium ovale wallikeri]|uniref:PIR Superfamily Protein n=1 Tax=Plasmodium ovale wallikeri TaxID=864142 RepID=A0A1A9ADY2_PLAOA|nr:PIR Superfamily Protein [Plasmodium ovale wallikeri]SBT55772.1 PIR Superfamily Protein [Plasmodium ovale wallikeri]
MADDYDYNFFKEIHKYKIYKNLVNTNDASSMEFNNCNFDKNDFLEGDIEFAQKLCKKFKYLYQLITADEYHMLSEIYKKYEYTNYWLNYELKQDKKYSHISAKEFYKKLKGKDKDFDENNLQDTIHNISEVQLNNMKILEKLYVNYFELQDIIFVYVTRNKECSTYSNICYEQYEEAIKDCTNLNSTNFCKALEEYREKHELLLEMNTNLRICQNDELKKLPKNEEAIKEEMDRALQSVRDIHPSQPSEAYTGITTATVISVSLAVSVSIILLYMFTPFGSWLRHRIKMYIGIYKNSQDEIHNINLNSEEYTIRYNSIQ